MAEVLVRIATAVLALALIAGFAVELRAHDLEANAAKLSTAPKLEPTAVASALRDLKDARSLRPGTQAALLAAGLELRTQAYAQASKDAAFATRREPENFSAWVTLGVAQRALGQTRAAQASFGRAHRLNPLYPIPR